MLECTVHDLIYLVVAFEGLVGIHEFLRKMERWSEMARGRHDGERWLPWRLVGGQSSHVCGGDAEVLLSAEVVNVGRR